MEPRIRQVLSQSLEGPSVLSSGTKWETGLAHWLIPVKKVHNPEYDARRFSNTFIIDTLWRGASGRFVIRSARPMAAPVAGGTTEDPAKV